MLLQLRQQIWPLLLSQLSTHVAFEPPIFSRLRRFSKVIFVADQKDFLLCHDSCRELLSGCQLGIPADTIRTLKGGQSAAFAV